MTVPHCELVIYSSSNHVSQVLTGFGALRRSGEIRASVRRSDRFDPGVLGSRLDVVLDGQARLVYDLADGGAIAPGEGIEEADVYFKRSYGQAAASHPEAGKIYPLGLNYPVYGPGDWHVRRLWWSAAGLRPHNAASVATRMVRLSRVASWLTRANGGRHSSWVDRFTAPPEPAPDPRVLFLTRTWDPATATHATTADERRAMNALRAGSIRLLREELGPCFHGGLAPMPHALSAFPDCVVDERITRKTRYLRLMKTCDVCVTTRGLRDSNGWSLGEYVAASRAIVSEPLAYEVPGGFAADLNYLAMTSPEECVERVLDLLGDPVRRGAMMRRNHEYYERWVRPDALARSSLVTAAGHLGLPAPGDGAPPGSVSRRKFSILSRRLRKGHRGAKRTD